MKKYAVVLLIIFSIFLEAKLKDDYILYLDDHNKAIVIASGLNVRSLPNQKSEVIEMIPRNGIVEITNISKNTDVVNNLKNFWYEIKFSKNSVEPARKGWVFGAYLQILDVSIKKENLKYKNKDSPVKRWKRIINTKMQFLKEMKYITDDFEIPIYKTTADIQNKKEFRKIKENYEFYVTDKYYDETSYEMRNYFQFEHPGLGKVWISANYLHCVGDIKKYTAVPLF